MMEKSPTCSALSNEYIPFLDAMEKENDFSIRRAIERLREGLFDPVAVRLLTAHEERLQNEIKCAFKAMEAGKPPHLCIVGSYGQGKSHSLLYIQDMALMEGFVTSRVNLDPREVPFNNFRKVYRELMTDLQFPNGGRSFPAIWRDWVRERMKEPGNSRQSIAELLPERMPHLFKSVLLAMVQGNTTLSEREKRLKKHSDFRPREFPLLLIRTLEGEPVPAHRLSKVFQYRQVPSYRDGSLSVAGDEPLLQMIQSLSCLFRKMGYRGWVLLFDEGESIAQGNTFARSRSYRLLQRFFFPDPSIPAFLFPVFAFTEDFLERVDREDYDRIVVRRGTEAPLFDRNYAREWRNLNLYRLDALSRKEWGELARKLICLHARAYGWEPPEARLAEEMERRLESMSTQETRLKLKALVECLDLPQQEQAL